MGRRVFILGAGFSKAAGMPLATELTAPVIRKATLNGDLREMTEWLDDLKLRLGNAKRLNIEELFHYAPFDAEFFRLRQHLCPVGRHDGQTPYGQAESIETWMSYLEEALTDVIWQRQQRAKISTLAGWARIVRTADTIVSFNYDLLAEQALRRRRLRWHHGFHREKGRGVRILKLHGSVDWMTIKRCRSYRKECTLLYRKTNHNHRGAIDAESKLNQHVEEACDLVRSNSTQLLAKNINPFLTREHKWNALAGLGTYKTLSRVPDLGEVWDNACHVLYRAKEVIVIGFSFSNFDGFARMQFSALGLDRRQKNKDLPRLTVIDPLGIEVAERAKQVFRPLECRVFDVAHQEMDWHKL